MELSGFLWRVAIIQYSTLPSNAKFIGMYLSTWMNDHGDGCFPSIARISQETGLTKPTAIKYISILRNEGWLIAEKRGFDGQKWARNQYYPSIPNNQKTEIATQLNSLTTLPKGGKTGDEGGKNDSKKVVKELNTIYTDNITNNIGKNGKRFIPPSLQEVEKYCREKNKSVDPAEFWNFYASKGWYVGKNKMKSWHSAVALWHSRNKEKVKDQFEDCIT